MSSKSKNPDLAAGRLNRDAGGHDDSHEKKPKGSTYGTNRLGLQLGPEVEEEAPVVDEAPAAAPVKPAKAIKPASPIAPPRRPLRWEAPRPEPPLEPVEVLPPPVQEEEKPQAHPWMEHRPKTQRQGGGLSPAPIPISPPGPSVKAGIPIRGTVILGVAAAGLFLMLMIWGIASLVSSDSVEPTGPAVAAAAPPAPAPQAPPVSPPQPAPAQRPASPAPKPRPTAPARAQTDRAMAWLAEQTRELTQPEGSGNPGNSTGSPQGPGASPAGSPSGGSVAYDMVPAGIRLRGIIHQPGASYADINGRFVQEGQTIGGAKVVRISRFFVEMEADGKRFQLRFKQQAPKPEPQDDEYEDEGDYEDEEQREQDDEDADSRPPRRRRPSRR